MSRRVHVHQAATASLDRSRASRTFGFVCVCNRVIANVGRREEATVGEGEKGRGTLVTLTVATFSGPPSEEEPERSSSFQGQLHGITLPCI